MTNVEKYLLEKGVRPDLRGFEYITLGVELIKKDRKYKYNVTRLLYPTIANMFNESPSNIERCIRHAIEGLDKTYTNSEFLALAELETREEV